MRNNFDGEIYIRLFLIPCFVEFLRRATASDCIIRWFISDTRGFVSRLLSDKTYDMISKAEQRDYHIR